MNGKNVEGNYCGLSKYYTRFQLKKHCKNVKNFKILGVWPRIKPGT
jgi:hypothetical protein